MSAAATLLAKSQPAISNLITRLEDELGVSLFERKKGRLQVTPEATLFYEEARRTLGVLERTRQVARDLKGLRSGTLSLASQPGLATYALPPIIARLLTRWPEGTVRFITRSSPTVRDLGRIEAFDIGFAEHPIESPASVIETIEVPCVCMLPADHPLAAEPVITPAHLDDAPFISPNMKSLISTIEGTQSFGLPKNSRQTVRVCAGMRCTTQRAEVIRPSQPSFWMPGRPATRRPSPHGPCSRTAG